MESTPTYKEIIDCINNPPDEGKANCSLGFFVREYFAESESEAEDSREVDSLYIKKPVVKISSFMEDQEVFHDIQFVFRSFNDSDYKQLWTFLCKFGEKTKRQGDLLAAGNTLNKAIALSASILPDQYSGKYYVHIAMPFTETISRTENAFDKSAVISFICPDVGFGAFVSDDDLVDRAQLNSEVLFELDAENLE